MKQIVVLSGKGGVGKSSIAGSLAVMLSREKKIIGVDCDVDASNFGLVLGIKEFDSSNPVKASEKAGISAEKCISCKKCFETCVFDAITWNNETNKPEINYFLCEGCGACELVCPANAIDLKKVVNANLSIAETKYGFPLVSGQLVMGESGSGKVVAEVKEKAYEIAKEKKTDLIIVDASAGIGCPVIASVTGADFVVGVTEPSPSAFADLKRALKMVGHFQIPCGLIINKCDLNNEITESLKEFAEKNSIPLLAEIPYNQDFVDALVNLTPLVEFNQEFEGKFNEIIANLKKAIDLG